MQEAKHTQGAYNAMMAGLHCLHLEADVAVANDIQRLVREAFASVLAERDACREACKKALPFLRGLRDGLVASDPTHNPKLYEQTAIDAIESALARAAAAESGGV